MTASSERISIADIEAFHPSNRWNKNRQGEQRFFCPIHGGGSQRSLTVRSTDGVFHCHACLAKGVVKDFWKPRDPSAVKRDRFAPPIINAADVTRPPPAVDYSDKVIEFAAALPGSLGAEFLARRKIPLEVAQRCFLGYSAKGQWLNPNHDWQWGRLVFPHTDNLGDVVSLYGRAVGSNDKVPKHVRHDQMSGPKGVFNGLALNYDEVFLTEGAFDALALMAAGVENVAACFGVNNVYWPWVRAKTIIFAFDLDQGGKDGLEKLANEAILRGKNVYYLPSETYQGCKDLAEAWEKYGTLGDVKNAWR